MMSFSVVNAVWLMIVSACLTLGGMYFLVWFRNRERPHLYYSINALSMSAFAFCELWIMRVHSTEAGVLALQCAQVALTVWLVSNVWFVKSYLGAGRAWLAWTILIVRLLVLPLNFLPGQTLTYREITSLDQIWFFGEIVTVLNGEINPWQVVTQAAVLLILVFVADASITAWRRGDRRKALVVGGSVEFTILAAVANAQPVLWDYARLPFMFSLPYMGLVVVMAYELSRDVLRASQLVRDLQASEAGLRENQARLEASSAQISSLFGRLIAAQETERARIARDLHDDIGQRIAGISIAMSGLKRKLEAHHPALEALTAMQRETIALAEGVRHVSHELHPTLLQHAGLVEALRGLCAQYQKFHVLTVDYRADPGLDALPHNAALALYRVAQEALRNVSKHADASHVELSLTRIEDGVQLSVVDNGKGFNAPDRRGRGDGLGLRSIDERVRFLSGRVDLQTAAGTRHNTTGADPVGAAGLDARRLRHLGGLLDGRHLDVNPGAIADFGHDADAAAGQPDSFRDADQTEAGRVLGRFHHIETAAVVGDGQLGAFAATAQENTDALRLRMRDHVAKGFLRHAIEAERGPIHVPLEAALGAEIHRHRLGPGQLGAVIAKNRDEAGVLEHAGVQVVREAAKVLSEPDGPLLKIRHVPADVVTRRAGREAALEAAQRDRQSGDLLAEIVVQVARDAGALAFLGFNQPSGQLLNLLVAAAQHRPALRHHFFGLPALRDVDLRSDQPLQPAVCGPHRAAA